MKLLQKQNEFVSQGTNSPMDGEKLKGHLLRYIIYYYRLEFFYQWQLVFIWGVKFMLSTAEDKAKSKKKH